MRVDWPKYRWSVAAVCALLALDLVCSVLAYLSLHGYSLRSPSVSWSAFGSFRRDALDVVFACVLRLSLLAGVFALCLLYATPDYDAALADKRRAARLHNRTLSGLGGEEAAEADSGSAAAEQSVSVAINSGSKYEPLLASSAPHEPEAAPLPLPTELSQTEKHAVNQRCSRFRMAGYVFIFVLCTAMQVCIGVKVVSFDFPADSREWPIALFLALPILFINLEQHYCTAVIKNMTREEGYLFKKLHPHKLYFDITAYGHGCDVCRKRIKESYRSTSGSARPGTSKSVLLFATV